jgi:hypothetical protein
MCLKEISSRRINGMANTMTEASSSIQTVTVGTGVAPVLHFLTMLADCTADREFHPALKSSVQFDKANIPQRGGKSNRF